MKSLAQWNMNRPKKLADYESITHSKFLTKYAGQPLCFDDVYTILKNQTPENWKIRANDFVLDLGCGTGWYARKLSCEPEYQNTQIIGLDISPNALEIAHAKQMETNPEAHVSYRYADLTEEIHLPCAREIWYCGALHQTGNPALAFKRAANALSDDGIMRIQTYAENPAIKQPIDIAIMRASGHHIFVLNELDDIVAQNNMETISREQIGLIEFRTVAPRS